MLNNCDYSKMFLYSPGDSIPQVTPLTAGKFAELAARAGFPKGVINILPGSGKHAFLFLIVVLYKCSYRKSCAYLFFTHLVFGCISVVLSPPAIKNLGRCTIFSQITEKLTYRRYKVLL